MSTWTVVELAKDASKIEVFSFRNLESARNDFLDRYNRVKADGGTMLNFELEREGKGMFETTRGIVVWLVEAPLTTVAM